MTSQLKSPYPFFGGKSRIADLVWSRFGRPDNFVEPFFGSGAVLLACPHPGHTETVNDADGLLANFWRALQYAPNEVAQYADWPVNEVDLHARHRWLVDRRSIVEELMADPEWYDAKAAGWWVWGICQWIGTGWCPPSPAGDAGRGIHRASDAHARGVTKDGDLWETRPHLGGVGSGTGIHGKRLSQKMPHLQAGGGPADEAGSPHHGRGVHSQTIQGALYDYFRALAARLRRTRVVCGDFERILGPSVTWRHGMTAVFLDPPYADAEHAVTYSGGGNVWERVTRWCEANGDHKLLRIALCGYEGTWTPPAGWEAVRWRTSGGYGSQGNGRGRDNAAREVVWFSPACLGINDLPLFRGLAE